MRLVAVWTMFLITVQCTLAQVNVDAKSSSTIVEEQVANQSYPELYKLAREAGWKGQYNSSLKLYSNLLDLYPNDVDGLLGRGLVYYWSGDYSKAEIDLKAVLSAAPKYVDAWQTLGNIYLADDEFTSAIESYSKWQQLEPSNPLPLLAIGKAHIVAGNNSDAQPYFIKALELGISPAIIQPFLRGNALKRIPTSWESALDIEYDSFGSDDKKDWVQFKLSTLHQWESVSVNLGVKDTRRFGLRNQAIALDSYLNLWKSAYVNLLIQTAFDPEILPENDILLELYQGLPFQTEFSLNTRIMEFPSTSVRFLGAGIALYKGQYYLRYRFTRIYKENGNGLAQTVWARRYHSGINNYFEFVGSSSYEIFLESSSNTIATHEGWSVALNWHQTIKRNMGMTCGLTYESLEDFPSRRQIRVGTFYQW